MYDELGLSPEAADLWRTPPRQMGDAAIRVLREEMQYQMWAALGVDPALVRAAALGLAPQAVELADRILDGIRETSTFPGSVWERPSFAQRAVAAVLILVPAARLGSRIAAQRLISVLVNLRQSADDDAFAVTLGPDWRDFVSDLVEHWMAWTLAPADDEERAPGPTDATTSPPKRRSRFLFRGPIAAVAARRNPVPTGTVRVLASPPDVSDEAPTSESLRRYEFLASEVPIGARPCADALDSLDRDYPNFAEVTRCVRDEIRLAERSGAARVRLVPRLLVGPPGIGKSRYARALAHALGRPYRLLPGGTGEARALAGTARGWSTATPSFPIRAMADERRADPLIVVDEVDKAPRESSNPTIQPTLLSMLDPSTARAWFDECLMVPCDLSWIAWFLTVNDIGGIVAPLADRCRVHQIGRPNVDSFDSYLVSILADIAEELDVPVAALPELSPAVRRKLRNGFRRNPALRPLIRATRGALAIGPMPVLH